jgi:hypothetical protein
MWLALIWKSLCKVSNWIRRYFVSAIATAQFGYEFLLFMHVLVQVPDRLIQTEKKSAGQLSG